MPSCATLLLAMLALAWAQDGTEGGAEAAADPQANVAAPPAEEEAPPPPAPVPPPVVEEPPAPAPPAPEPPAPVVNDPPAPPRSPSAPITHYAMKTEGISAEPRRLVDANNHPPIGHCHETKQQRKAAGVAALDAAKIPWNTGQWVYSDQSHYVSDEGPVECAHRCEANQECHHWNWHALTSLCEFKGEQGIGEDGDGQFGRDYVLTGEATRMRRLRESKSSSKDAKEL